MYDVVLHRDVFAPKVMLDLFLHVGKQASHFTGQVENVRRLDSLEKSMGFLWACQIGVLGFGE